MFRLIFLLCLLGLSMTLASVEQKRSIVVPADHLYNSHSRHYKTIITNASVVGNSVGCAFHIDIDVNPNVNFKMCIGQELQHTKNNRAIIELIKSRGFMPTCRVLHLLMWMYTSVSAGKVNSEQAYFVDVGANIGSCTAHIASLGYPVIAVEPVVEHMKAIQGTMAINPSFHIEPHRIGISSTDRVSKGSILHGAQNWGSSEIVEDVNGTDELVFRTLGSVLGRRKIALLKVDCEGCEYAALKGASQVLAPNSATRIEMMKLEIIMPTYIIDFNSTTSVPTKDIILLLAENNYELFYDHWPEEKMYFGHGGKTVSPIDELFGSVKFKLPSDLSLLEKAARLILTNPVDPETFTTHTAFHKLSTDVIAIDKELATKMRKLWL